jgi:hypothetical protein
MNARIQANDLIIGIEVVYDQENATESFSYLVSSSSSSQELKVIFMVF